MRIAWTITLAASCALGTACNEPIDFTAPGTSTAGSSYSWHGPDALDLGDVRDPTAASFYATSAAFYDAAHSRSFGDYRVDATTTAGVLASSFYDGTSFRAFGRAYAPYSQGGSGWMPYGTGSAYLDGGASYNFTNLATAIHPSWGALTVFSDGLATHAGDGALSTGNAWHSLASQLGSTMLAGTAPSNSQPVNGYSTSMAWDTYGHAFYAYPDTNGVGYLDRYSAFTAWDGPSINGIRLGPGITQTQLINDGYGVTSLSVGSDFVIASSLGLGFFHSCVLANPGPMCWGYNATGGTGNGTTTSPATKAALVGGLGAGSFTQISGGIFHSCAITVSGTPVCWGDNTYGQVGADPTVIADPLVPRAVSGIPTPVLAISAGGDQSCAIGSDRNVYCWGKNDVGQLGRGTTSPYAFAPLKVAVITAGTAVKVVSGTDHACALTSDHKVYCWGSNNMGQLGNNALGTDSSNPVLASNAAYDLAQGAASSTPCLMDNANRAYCWGQNGAAQATIGAASAGVAVPTLVALGIPIRTIAPGNGHVCALTTAGAVYCWGDNNYGQMGNGTSGAAPVTTPALVALPSGVTVNAIASGGYFTCLLTDRGADLCWGRNGDNEIIGSTTSNQLTPTDAVASTTSSLQSAWSLDSNFAHPTILSTGDVKSMASATDGQGNVVSVFLQVMPNFPSPPAGSIVPPYFVRNNSVRVYAAMRGASGTWTGPTQIDDASQFVLATTTIFQDARGSVSTDTTRATGGIEYPTPAVAYVGGGRFLAAFPMTDLANSTSSIYVRGYTIGSGWDASSQTYLLDSMNIATTTDEAYRFANDLSMVSDGQGNALLMAQVVVPTGDGSIQVLRGYGIKTYRYSAANGGWSSTPTLISNSICNPDPVGITVIPATNYFCWNLKPQGMIFPSGEAVVVYPAPAGTGTTSQYQLRLYTMGYHP